MMAKDNTEMAAKTAVKARPKKRIKGKTRAAGKARRGGRGTDRAELARFRSLLLAERDRLERELQEIGHRTARIDRHAVRLVVVQGGRHALPPRYDIATLR